MSEVPLCRELGSLLDDRGHSVSGDFTLLDENHP